MSGIRAAPGTRVRARVAVFVAKCRREPAARVSQPRLAPSRVGATRGPVRRARCSATAPSAHPRQRVVAQHDAVPDGGGDVQTDQHDQRVAEPFVHVFQPVRESLIGADENGQR